MRLPDIDLLQQRTRSVVTESDPIKARDKLLELLRIYEIFNFDVTYEWPLWRARVASSELGYSNIAELHYPPCEITNAGRLNAPGSPLLYTSLNKFSTFAEVGAAIGDYVHLVGCTLNPNLRLKCAIVGEVFNIHRSGRATLSDHLTTELNRILVNSDYRAARSWVLLDAFFATLLADPAASQTQYLHSRTAAELIFEQRPNVDAIWYPGVALQNGVNLAIRPSAADKLLSSSVSFVLRIDRLYDYGIYDFTMLHHTDKFDSDGTILWNGRG